MDYHQIFAPLGSSRFGTKIIFSSHRFKMMVFCCILKEERCILWCLVLGKGEYLVRRSVIKRLYLIVARCTAQSR